MSKEFTSEEKAARIAKQRESARRNRERRAEWERQQVAEREAQLAALRRVRDNPDSSPADVLRAVELLDRLTPKY